VDRASANGTFVNGQRLHRNEVRVLRNGDDIRLGRLVLSAKFYTPNFG
jgi:pSer/pThr/pTyr-binding forkhead associated (FHA) protein